jgi:tyrosyl-tRNA synthetase
MYAAHYLPRLGYAKRAHLMNAMVPGLSGGKMSSSDVKSKIDFLDSAADIKAKIKAAVCTPGEVENNGVLAFLRAVLIPVQELRDEQARARGQESFSGEGSFVRAGAPKGTIFSIARPEKFGGDMHFASYQAVEDAYTKEELHPGDLKGGVTEALIALLTPIRKLFENSPEWQEAEKNGYPGASIVAAAAPKVVKQKAPKGSGRPPTEEERAILRAQKEKEKAAKAAKKSVLNTDLPKLKLLSKGKVRDIYALPDEKDADKLLFVATDRISAFDVIMNNVSRRCGRC